MLFLDFSEFVRINSMVALENVWLLELMNVQGLLYLTTMQCWTGPIRLSSLEIFLAWCTLEITAGKNIIILFPTDPKKESITCYFQVYDKLQINAPCGYRLNASELRNFPFTDVFTQVNLTMSDDGMLHLTDEELTEVTSSVTRFFEPTPRRRRTANTTESNTARDQSNTSSDNGIVRLQVHPEQQSEGGPRRSGRVQTAIVYDP